MEESNTTNDERCLVMTEENPLCLSNKLYSKRPSNKNKKEVHKPKFESIVQCLKKKGLLNHFIPFVYVLLNN